MFLRIPVRDVNSHGKCGGTVIPHLDLCPEPFLHARRQGLVEVDLERAVVVREERLVPQRRRSTHLTGREHTRRQRETRECAQPRPFELHSSGHLAEVEGRLSLRDEKYSLYM